LTEALGGSGFMTCQSEVDVDDQPKMETLNGGAVATREKWTQHGKGQGWTNTSWRANKTRGWRFESQQDEKPCGWQQKRSITCTHHLPMPTCQNSKPFLHMSK